MSEILIGLGIVVAIIVLVYNFLVGKKNQVDNIFGSVDTILKKRYNLIPNLVATVEKYMEHERGTLEKVTELRAKAMKGDVSDDEKVSLNNMISSALGGIMVAVENYPELKANENFMHLQRSLNEIEEQISAARRAYNQAVTDYNNAIEMFPSNIVAGYLSYKRKRVFEVEDTQRENPNVKDLFDK